MDLDGGFKTNFISDFVLIRAGSPDLHPIYLTFFGKTNDLKYHPVNERITTQNT